MRTHWKRAFFLIFVLRHPLHNEFASQILFSRRVEEQRAGMLLSKIVNCSIEHLSSWNRAGSLYLYSRGYFPYFFFIFTNAIVIQETMKLRGTQMVKLCLSQATALAYKQKLNSMCIHRPSERPSAKFDDPLS